MRRLVMLCILQFDTVEKKRLSSCPNYSMIHLTCNITNLYYLARWYDRELCHGFFERLFYCICAILHPDTSLLYQFHHFYHQNEVSHATNLPRTFAFKKSEENWIIKTSAFWLPTKIRWDYIKEFLWSQGKQFEAPYRNAFYRIIKRFEESGGVTGRGQTEEDRCMAVTPGNIKQVKNYFTADSKSSICTVSYNLGIKVVVDPLDVFRYDSCRSSSVWPLPITPPDSSKRLMW